MRSNLNLYISKDQYAQGSFVSSSSNGGTSPISLTSGSLLLSLRVCASIGIYGHKILHSKPTHLQCMLRGNLHLLLVKRIRALSQQNGTKLHTEEGPLRVTLTQGWMTSPRMKIDGRHVYKDG